MRARLVAGLLVALLSTAPLVHAQNPAKSGEPVVLRADEVTYDQDQGLVTASGNVEVAQGERILLADRMTYNEQTDKITASGDVKLLEPSGEVVFADELELSDAMKRGIIHDIRVLLADDTRFAANTATLSEGNRIELHKATFSPCRLCPDHPDRPPLWQIKAVRVVRDKDRQNVEYTDAFLEVFGVPIAYTPYFSHPDPTVKRRSGFLTPTFSSRSELGFTAEVPYYFNLAPNRDFTFAPIFTSAEGVVLAGEYRERTESGGFAFSSSITRPRARGNNGELVGGREARGHIDGGGSFKLGDSWNWGFQAQRSTDDTYLRRYGLSFADTLTSRLFLEGSAGRNYAALNSYAFQGLEVGDDPGKIPLVLPIADYSYVGERGALGGRYTLDANFMALSRTEGVDSRRISLAGGWQRPYLGPAGDIYTLTASLRGDVYWLGDSPKPGGAPGDTESEMTSRFVPLLSLDWRYPLIRQSGSVRQVIEPVLKFAISPRNNNPNDIPDEDSQDFEFSDINLFSNNRFPGLDRVEGGPRLSYGLRMGVYGASGGRTTAFIGQSLRTSDDEAFAPGSGLAGKSSDFVGRINVAPSKFIDLAYRFRIDHDGFAPRRSEIDLASGPDWLRFNLGFLSLDDAPADLANAGKRDEINMSAIARLDENWSFTAHNRRDLANDKTINFGFGLTYQDECLLIATRFERRFTQDRDFEPETSIKFIVKLKHLG